MGGGEVPVPQSGAWKICHARKSRSCDRGCVKVPSIQVWQALPGQFLAIGRYHLSFPEQEGAADAKDPVPGG
jgi:hypothetical protein